LKRHVNYLMKVPKKTNTYQFISSYKLIKFVAQKISCTANIINVIKIEKR